MLSAFNTATAALGGGSLDQSSASLPHTVSWKIYSRSVYSPELYPIFADTSTYSMFSLLSRFDLATRKFLLHRKPHPSRSLADQYLVGVFYYRTGYLQQ
ncbi:hypothetical protein D7322_28205 [Sphingobacterium puteale]|uniref:Uncharacterized protein n=1 Tax=Sphingobacterium puteale TaxID=2420510 RepID=A0A420VPI7_9SPHI|nr:hypothetical protein D7322_28205 [Sphingobacterium puteale]